MNNPIKNPRTNMRKVTVATLYVICVLFIAPVSCAEQKENTPQAAGVCEVTSFLDGVSSASEYSEIYIIKGVVLSAYKNGLKIRLIEDLKGNLPKGVTTCNVWKNIQGYIEDNRLDNLGLYDCQDILVMLLKPGKPTGYTTPDCIPSVLKLSDGYVTGNIIPWSERLERWGIENLTDEAFEVWVASLSDDELKSYTMKDTLSWNEFQKRLQEIIKIK